MKTIRMIFPFENECERPVIVTPRSASLGVRPRGERCFRALLAALVLVIFVFVPSPPAHADVAGQVCVENGGALSVNGKRSSGRCMEGTMVRLYGVAAPPLSQECTVGDREVWRCGLASAAALLQAVRGRQVNCVGNSTDPDGRLIAICFVAGRSLNQFMIEMGWAEADDSVTSMYNDYEASARQAGRGLWSSDFASSTDG